MAKRVRGSRYTHRPGGQGPVRPRRSSDAAGPPAADASTATWDADIDDAIDLVMLEAPELSIEDPAPNVPPTGRPRRGTKVKADSLTARVAAENVYIREDLRRIGVVTAILLAGLAVAWVLFVQLDALGLY